MLLIPGHLDRSPKPRHWRWVGVTASVIVPTRAAVGVAVGVFVTVKVAVLVPVFAGVPVGVSVTVSVTVAVAVSVEVGVGVSVDVDVSVAVGVADGVFVAVSGGVPVGVIDAVLVGVAVGLANSKSCRVSAAGGTVTGDVADEVVQARVPVARVGTVALAKGVTFGRGGNGLVGGDHAGHGRLERHREQRHDENAAQHPESN